MSGEEEYSLVVRFDQWSYENDEIAMDNFPGLPIEEAQLQQLRRELQSACDEGILAGSFKIISGPFNTASRDRDRILGALMDPIGGEAA